MSTTLPEYTKEYQFKHSKKSKEAIYNIQVENDHLTYSNSSNVLNLLSFENLKFKGTFKNGHLKEIRNLKIKNNLIYTCSEDKTFKLFDVRLLNNVNTLDCKPILLFIKIKYLLDH